MRAAAEKEEALLRDWAAVVRSTAVVSQGMDAALLSKTTKASDGCKQASISGFVLAAIRARIFLTPEMKSKPTAGKGNGSGFDLKGALNNKRLVIIGTAFIPS